MSDIVISLVVSPILQEALSKAVSFATSFARTHILNSGDLKTQMGELEYSLTMMQDLLKVAEDRDKRRAAVRQWLQRIEDEAHSLVEILDKCAYAVHQQEVGTRIQIRLTSISHDIRKIKDRLDSIRLDAGFIHLLRNDATLSQGPIETNPYSSDNSEVLGRDDDVSKVVSLLSDLSGQNRLSGLSIVGMPGIGKTALAGSICKRAEEENLYDLVAWVCLSNNFDEKMILKGMLEYLGGNGGSMDNTGAILQRLKSMLGEKRFLLVLDDVWNEVPRSWKTLFSYLLKILKTTGNSIVVTTSSERVVASTSVMAAVPMHKYELQKLSNDDCWLIMEEKVLSSSNLTSIEDPELLATGQAIAEQCGGLPLVADVIGEALSQHIGADKWSAISDNAAWDSPHRKEILSKLKRSFDRLPSPLKKCFSYCSIFPKGSEIRRDEVVQLWMAKGFLYQCHGSKSDEQEDVGDRYLKDLVSNFLFEDVKMDDCGNIESCTMHSQMHNLALFLSKHETYVWPDAHCIEECSSIRHMRVGGSNTGLPAIPAYVPQRLHSLFLDVDVFHTMASNLKSLRSLKLVAAKTEQLGASLDKSKCHIKYLDISKMNIQGLPDSITKLYNLQTLRVPACQSLKKLPRGIEYLVSLRHIYFDDEGHMPRGIGKLTSLQTLPLFVVGTKDGQKIEELKHLKQLRGKLKICNLEEVGSSREAAEANLEKKVNLIKLQFIWSGRTANSNDMDVLKGLKPNSKLKNLTIKNYKGSNFPSWMVKGDNGSDSSFRLNSLVKLKLIDCDECGNISSLGLLPELKVLTLRAMSKVKNIVSNHDRSNVASSSQGGEESIKLFPALRKFKLISMKRLEGWIEVQSKLVFPCLEELHVRDCPKLKFYHNRSNMASNSQGGEESITLFPALRKLTLCEMKTLVEWTEVRDTAVFPCLEELHIQNCPELQTWRIDASISYKLSMLSIQSCVNLRDIRAGKLNLKSLDINDCPKLMAYAQEGSPEWFTIRHIGRIRINGQVVPS